jgi:hypothetical protein
VGKQYAGHKIALALGITTFRRASNYNKKEANALAAVTARVLAVRGANRGDKGLSAMVEYYTGVAVLHKPRQFQRI